MRHSQKKKHVRKKIVLCGRNKVYSFPERCDMNSKNEGCQGILYNEATKPLSRAKTAEELHMKTEY